MPDAPHDPGPFTGRCLLFDLESTVAAEGHERIFAPTASTRASRPDAAHLKELARITRRSP